MTATLEACINLRAHFRPGLKIAGGLECISFPFPTATGRVAIIIRAKTQPTTARLVFIPESDWKRRTA